MLVAARAFAPLIAIFGAGESSSGSLKVAVMSSDVPAFTGPVGEYEMAAVGAVVSIVTDRAPEAELALAAASVAVAVMLCVPCASVLDVIVQLPLRSAVVEPT